jgi:hypothetical protein
VHAETEGLFAKVAAFNQRVHSCRCGWQEKELKAAEMRAIRDNALGGVRLSAREEKARFDGFWHAGGRAAGQ